MRSLLFVALFCMIPSLASAAEPAALKLLFLGDNGHHRPARRFAELAPVMEKRKIELTYIDDPAKALSA
jgi:hypothetical protein